MSTSCGPKEVRIYVRGGVAHVDEGEIPEGVRVVICDFDIDGVEESNLTILPDGEMAVVGTYTNS